MSFGRGRSGTRRAVKPNKGTAERVVILTPPTMPLLVMLPFQKQFYILLHRRTTNAHEDTRKNREQQRARASPG